MYQQPSIDAALLKGADLEKAIAERPFPKVTKASITDKIADVKFLQFDETTIICGITMKNGYGVRGESACVDPRNFDMEIGKGLAYEHAFNELWHLEGYLLAEQMSTAV